MNLIYLLIPILSLLIMVRLFSPFKGVFFNPAGFVVLLYLVSLFFSIVLGTIITVSVYELNFWVMVYLSVLLLLYFIPLFLASYSFRNEIDISQKKIIYYLAWIFAIGGVFSFIYFLDGAIYMMSGDIVQKRNDWSWYGIRDINFEPSINYVATGFATFFGLNQLLAYYVRFFFRRSLQNNVLFFLLILGSLSYVVLVLTFAGRDGILYWFFSVVFVDLLFYKFCGSSLILNNMKKFLIFIFLLFVPFFMITISRFGDGFFISVIDYLGQMPFHLNDLIIISPPPMLGLTSFPDFYSIISSSNSKASDWDHYFFNEGTVPWVFAYFFGSFVKDFGPLFTIIISFFIFLISLLYLYFVHNSRVVYFDSLMAFYLYAQIGFMGVFYFKHYALNNFLIFYVLILLILYFLRLKRINHSRAVK